MEDRENKELEKILLSLKRLVRLSFLSQGR